MAKIYNPDEITLSIGGNQIKGYAAGEFAVLEEAAERIVKVVGTDGEVAISRVLDRSGTLTIKLLQTSDSNDVFENMMALNQRGPGLPGVKPLYMRDRNGRSIHEAPACWVEKAPNVSYDRSATPREWVLGFGEISNQVKGANNG